MKIPKYIEAALDHRSKAAYMFNHYDYILTKFINKNGLDNKIDMADYCGGVEAIVNPDESCDRIRQAIIDKE